MVRFEELQQLWQSQPEPEEPTVAAEYRGMAAELKRFRRRQYVINGIKLVVIVCLAWFTLSRLNRSVLAILGQGLLLAGFVLAIATDWRIQAAIARLDFTRPSVAFLDTTLEWLRDPNKPFRRTGWLGIALVAAGVNVMLASRAAIETSGIVSHITATFLVFAGFAFGLKVRAERYAMEYKPLVERLSAMKATLEEA